MAKMIALRKSAKAENGDVVKKVESVRDQTTFRGMAVTGKYLHENDNRWCIKNTRYSSNIKQPSLFLRKTTMKTTTVGVSKTPGSAFLIKQPS